MSILLMVRPKGSPKPSSTTPIATEEVFEKEWLPGIVALGSQWLPVFQVGVDLELSDLPVVIAELLELRNWFVVTNSRSGVIDRVDLLLSELNSLMDEASDADIFIG